MTAVTTPLPASIICAKIHGSPIPAFANAARADERFRELERKQPALEQKSTHEHRQQRDKEDSGLLTPAEPQMSGSWNRPRGHANQHERPRLGRGPRTIGSRACLSEIGPAIS